jgi:hypothetical protein
MDDKPIMDIIRMWCVGFSVEYIEERKYWQGVIVHKSTMHRQCLYEQETGTHEEYNDVLIQAVDLLKSRVLASCCIIEGNKESKKK